MITNGVDGSAIHYTISYIDSNTGDICSSFTISASLCVQRICTVPSISPLPCSNKVGDGDIDISISAINRLGRGPPAVTSIGTRNDDATVYRNYDDYRKLWLLSAPRY